MSNFKKQFGKRIAELRNNLKLTQVEFAEKVNLSESAVVRIETGNAFPKTETIEAIACVLDVEYKELFDFKKDKDYTNSKLEILNTIEHIGTYHPELLPIAKIFLRLLKQK